MKTSFLLAGILAATLSRAGDSAPFRLDTRAGIRAARATEPLAYSTDWNSGATGVAIDLDGAPLFSAASPASGDYVWNTDGLPDGLHTLMFDDGVETLDAQFYVNPGRIVFNANGGEETMPDFTLIPGAEQTLPESTFTKDGHFLLGWAFSPDGEATLLDGDSTADIVAEAGETVTLYAVWHEGEDGGSGVGSNLVLNGDFEAAGYTGNYIENCGSAYLINWLSNNAGICTPKGTYLSRSIAGTNSSAWAFLKGASSISQSIVVSKPGKYRLEFDFCGREFHITSANALVSFGEIAITNIVDDGGTANGSKVVHYSFDVPVVSSGEYLLKFEQTTSADRSPAFDNISFRKEASSYAVRFDANGGEGAMAKRVYA